MPKNQPCVMIILENDEAEDEELNWLEDLAVWGAKLLCRKNVARLDNLFVERDGLQAIIGTLNCAEFSVSHLFGEMQEYVNAIEADAGYLLVYFEFRHVSEYTHSGVNLTERFLKEAKADRATLSGQRLRDGSVAAQTWQTGYTEADERMLDREENEADCSCRCVLI